MDYKQKYEEALEKARVWKEKSGMPIDRQGILDDIFPELKDSEDDKIRKEIIEFICWAVDRGSITDKQRVKYNLWVAWLEKYKINDDIKPKFKVGDYIINGHGFVMQIDSIDNNRYIYHVLDNSNKRLTYDITKTDKSCHLWTIQDAKNGDVLCGYLTSDYPWIGIFNELNGEYTFKSYCFLQAGINGKFCPPSGVNIFGKRNVDEHNSEIMVPATKEQRDILFQKMKEAGYEWDAEKKELKKIEQKTTQSVKDEVMFNSALWHINNSTHNGLTGDGSSVCEWLKSLKERLKGE